MPRTFKLGMVVALIAVQLVFGAVVVHAAPSSQGGRVHVVRRGETLSSIARRYGTSIQALVRANGLRNPNFIFSGQRLVIPGRGAKKVSSSRVSARGGKVHVVRRGETLSSIARRYGVSVRALARANGLRNTNFIFSGQRLVIPGGGSSRAVSVRTVRAPTAGRWIEVDLSRQTLYAWEGQRLIRTMLISSGLPRTPTPTGRFRIRVKYHAQTMVGPGYRFPNVPHVMYFWGAYALHGTYWHNSFGRPMSHGCVNLSLSDAKWLYHWAGYGTPVVIHR